MAVPVDLAYVIKSRQIGCDVTTQRRTALMKLSLVIPCYNEAQGLPLLVEKCRRLHHTCGAEIILVDNGSTDDSEAILARLTKGEPGLRMISVGVNRGYGHGIVAGLRAATGDVLGWTHADLQTDPADAARAFALFGETANPERLFVKGRRYGRPLTDRLFTAGMSLFETILTRRSLWDINAQPTLFHRSFFESWSDPPDDFSLDLFAFWQARIGGRLVRRIPVLFGKRAYGRSHWNLGMSARVRFIARTLDYSFQLRRRLRSTSEDRPAC